MYVDVLIIFWHAYGVWMIPATTNGCNPYNCHRSIPRHTLTQSNSNTKPPTITLAQSNFNTKAPTITLAEIPPFVLFPYTLYVVICSEAKSQEHNDANKNTRICIVCRVSRPYDRPETANQNTYCQLLARKVK